MRAVIFANGELHRATELHADDLLIAADGGARHCLALGLKPAIVIGDLDSLDENDLAALKAAGIEIIRYPERKDYTDLELALQYAQEQGVTEILVMGALGARWDQTIANILLPAAFSPLKISLTDGPQELFFIRGGEQLQINGQQGDTVSLIPLTNDTYGITTQGLEYALNDENLSFGSTRGISNVLLEEEATISLKAGLLLCTVIHTSN